MEAVRRILVALSILACAVLFFWIAKNRESLCGLAGRSMETSQGWRKSIAGVFVSVCDLVHWERGYAVRQYKEEQAARSIFQEGIRG